MRESRARLFTGLTFCVLVATLTVAAFTGEAFAHVRYVLNDEEIAAVESQRVETPFPGEILAVVMLGLLLLVVTIQFLGLHLAGGELARKMVRGLSSFDEYVPLIVRVFVGLFLVWSGLSAGLFSPQPGFELGPLSSLVSALELVAGILLIIGFLVKIGALLLAALVGIAFVILGAHGLDQLVLLGVATMLFFEGGLSFSVDKVTLARVEWLRRIGDALMRLKVYSMPALRLTLGVTLIWLSLTEKLLAPELTEAAVLKYNVPVFPSLHQFVLFFGFFELVLGAHYLLGIFNRLISAIYLLLLVSAIFLFGETVNHLHLFAVAAAFLIRGAGSYRMDIVLRTKT